jgi:hypothetical protein
MNNRARFYTCLLMIVELMLAYNHTYSDTGSKGFALLMAFFAGGNFRDLVLSYKVKEESK